MLFKLIHPQHIVMKGQNIHYYHDTSHGVTLSYLIRVGGAACLIRLDGEMRL